MKNVMKIDYVLPIYNLAYMASTIDKRMLKNHAGTRQGFAYGVNSAIKADIVRKDAEYVSMAVIQKAKECAIKAFIANPVPYYKSRLVLWTIVVAALDGTMSLSKLRKKAAENKERGLGLQVISEMTVHEQLKALQKQGYSLKDIERAAKSIRQAEEVMEAAAA